MIHNKCICKQYSIIFLNQLNNKFKGVSKNKDICLIIINSENDAYLCNCLDINSYTYF